MTLTCKFCPEKFDGTILKNGALVLGMKKEQKRLAAHAQFLQHFQIAHAAEYEKMVVTCGEFNGWYSTQFVTYDDEAHNRTNEYVKAKLHGLTRRELSWAEIEELFKGVPRIHSLDPRPGTYISIDDVRKLLARLRDLMNYEDVLEKAVPQPPNGSAA